MESHNFVFLVPIITSLGAFAMIFGIIYLRTRENMAMIEKGLNPKQYANRPAPYINLKYGLLLLGAGLGLLVAYLIDRSYSNFRHLNEPLYFSCIAIGGGVGLIVSYIIEKKELLNKSNTLE